MRIKATKEYIVDDKAMTRTIEVDDIPSHYDIRGYSTDITRAIDDAMTPEGFPVSIDEDTEVISEDRYKSIKTTIEDIKLFLSLFKDTNYLSHEQYELYQKISVEYNA